MAETNNPATGAKSNAPDARHEPLNVLLGTWDVEIPSPGEPSEIVHGSVTFEWLSGGQFMIGRIAIEHPDFPDSIAVIGYDESTGNFAQHYYDSRGVERVYGMSIIDGVLKLWRDGTGFSQRFTGTISDDGNAIVCSWESSADGSNWEHDFDLKFRRKK